MFVCTFLEIAIYRPVTQRFFRWVQTVIAEKLDTTQFSLQTSIDAFLSGHLLVSFALITGTCIIFSFAMS